MAVVGKSVTTIPSATALHTQASSALPPASPCSAAPDRRGSRTAWPSAPWDTPSLPRPSQPRAWDPPTSPPSSPPHSLSPAWSLGHTLSPSPLQLPRPGARLAPEVHPSRQPRTAAITQSRQPRSGGSRARAASLRLPSRSGLPRSSLSTPARHHVRWTPPGHVTTSLSS